jgi:hypothetical protein
MVRPHGQAEVDADNPRAFGKCDRCGDRCNLVNLRPQFEYAGPTLVNTGWLVCETCLDEPNPGLRTVIIPPDPMPVINPRFESWDIEEGTNIFSISQTTAGSTLSHNLGTTTPNQRTFTISLWMKSNDVTNFVSVFRNELVPNDTFLRITQYNDTDIDLQNYVAGIHDQSVWNDASGGTPGFVELGVWTHMIFAVDTTQAIQADRVKIYKNGVLHPTYIAVGIAQNDIFSNFMASNSTIYIPSISNLLIFNGRIAFIQVIDGKQCDPHELGGNRIGFGWSHKAYIGSYGNTGFYFSGDNGLNTRSGSGNAYTFVNGGVTLDYSDLPPHITL